MLPAIKMSSWHDGLLVRPPAVIAFGELRDILLSLTDFDEGKVDLICSSVEQDGGCELLDEDADCLFVLERILHS
ncbi:hypothetical protein [Pararhizobium antarcticum]|uniref:Uncharacterized protein n=1 Tax=Pararhizobium antarcticum TaxID=1798805 RepID=A0A657LUW1_9HYPH|nr:hypothetical protein [Pararhizobium antarcticum]OJF96236.1 hypothetical protein AX761_16130 [Rhizobium sp. 58]OJF97780.1 hypothetical protein AX760_16095 [Pararhizobium antarcticum]